MIALSISMPEDWSGSILYCESRFFYVSGFTNLQPLIFPDEISSNQSRKKTPSFPSYPILYFQKFFYYVTKTFFFISCLWCFRHIYRYSHLLCRIRQILYLKGCRCICRERSCGEILCILVQRQGIVYGFGAMSFRLIRFQPGRQTYNPATAFGSHSKFHGRGGSGIGLFLHAECSCDHIR